MSGESEYTACPHPRYFPKLVVTLGSSSGVLPRRISVIRKRTKFFQQTSRQCIEQEVEQNSFTNVTPLLIGYFVIRFFLFSLTSVPVYAFIISCIILLVSFV